MVIVDNNILSALAKADALHILPDLFNTVTTVPEVIHELRDESVAGYTFTNRILEVKTYEQETEEQWLQVATLTAEENNTKDRLLQHELAPADAECLATAQHRNEKLLTDDTGLHHHAENENIPTYDLETLLLTAAHNKTIADSEEAQRILHEIEEKDFYTFSESFKDQITTATENNE